MQGDVLIDEALRAGLVREIFVREDLTSNEFPGWSGEILELDTRTFDAVNDTVSPRGCLAGEAPFGRRP